MKREEYWKIMEIIDALHFAEKTYTDRHCKLNKDNPSEVRRRRRDQERYDTALGHLRAEIANAFYDELEA